MDTERTGPLAHRPGSSGTGDSRVDEAIARLAVLGEVPLDEHPPVLEAVHDRLREILGELGTVPPGGAPPDAPRGSPRLARPGEREQQQQQWQQGQLSPGRPAPRTPPAAPDGGPTVSGAGQDR